MDDAQQSKDSETALATFSQRLVAFGIDYGLFAAGYWLSLRIIYPEYQGLTPSRAAVWLAMWGAFFLLYQTYSSSEGRRSLGKALLGLRVVNGEGEPLSLAQAAIRTLGYLPSGVFGLGFLWSLFSDSRQTWHDMAVGSVVVSDRELGALGTGLVRAGALACLAVAATAWMWSNVWKPRYHRIMEIAYAHVGLKEMAELQKLYHHRNGRYAEDIFDLATVSFAPQDFLLDMKGLFDHKAGIKMKTSKKGFTIHARARDRRKTPVSISG